MECLDIFFLSDPGNIECEGKVFVPDGNYWHVLITGEQLERFRGVYSKFSELPTKRAGGRAYHTFAGHLNRLEEKDGGFDGRIAPEAREDSKLG